jgi:hypothetical protein
MVRNRFSPEDAESLRSKILRIVNDTDAPIAEVLKVLAHCHAQIENKMIVEQTLKECGLLFSGFKTNEHLELYNDIIQSRREVGCICKGWDDPGFRVGDHIEIPKWKIDELKKHTYMLLKYCATRGVAMTIEENEVQMDTIIYSDGFNKKVFAQVLHHLNECTAKAQQLLL